MERLERQPTQSIVQHQNILVSTHGSPLKINLQAVELEGRPKLVRTLKGSGALVVSNAKEAAIILVDSATESGKRLIRTWGHDTSKVVLEYTWVWASIDVGRPLLEADNWGGAMTVDDGKPVTIDGVVVDEDEFEEVDALVIKSPLPTPRVTPVSQRLEATAIERSDISESNTCRIAGLPLSAPAFPQPVMVGTVPSDELAANTRGDTLNAQSPPPITQPPYHQPSLSVQPSQSQNTYAYAPFATQQLYSSSQPSMVPTRPFLHTSPPSQHRQPQMLHAPVVSHTPLPSAQPPMSQMTPNVASMNGVNLEAANFLTLMTMMEVMRHMDQSSWYSQNSSNSSMLSGQSATFGPTPSTSTLQLTERSVSPKVDASLTDSQNHFPRGTHVISRDHEPDQVASEGHSTTQKPRVRPSRRPLDEKLIPSVSRKRPPAVKPTNPPPKRLRKGGRRGISTDSSEHTKADEPMESSDASCSTRSSTRLRNIAARRKHGEIFLSGSGQPLRFFVQVDLHGRHTVVTNIKKNKGKIVNNITDADYLILFSRSVTFQGLLQEAIGLGKFPILAAFVADCVEEGALLDESDYMLESVAKVKPLKPGHQNAFSVKVETSEKLHLARATKSESSSAAGKGKKIKETLLADRRSKKAIKPVTSKHTGEDCEDSPTSRSPTPPGEATRKLMKNGKYLFTEVEDEYLLRLARHHLTRDPTISNTALMYKLHKKLPHHSPASWSAHIDKKLKGTLEDIRKRANIAKRKRKNETPKRNVSEELPIEDALPKDYVSDTAQGGRNTPSSSSQPAREDLERQDFDAITLFFASGGGGDDDDDERVWQELEKHRPCRSASSWPDYYAAHQEEVYARIEELTGMHAGE